MIVCTVLSVRPYSGLYLACRNCLGKVLRQQESKWWCRKCSCVISSSEVHRRYCIAMAITDHSTPPQDVVVFGKSCDLIFGCSASHLTKYLGGTLNGNSENSDQILKAIEATLVGKCFAFVFCVPSIVKNQTSLLSITERFNERNTDAVEKRRELIVMTIKTICTGSDTVLSKLQHELESTPQPTSCLPSLAVNSLPRKRSKSIDDSNFFYDHTVPSGSSPSQQFSCLLETYSESQESSAHKYVMATPISQSQQRHTNCSSPPTLSLLLDTYSESSPPPKCECVSQEETEVTTIESGCHSSQTEPPSIMMNSMENTSHPQVVSKVAIQEYLYELSRTDWLVRELESDWESTQNKCSSPYTQQQCTFSLSEEMLRELQEPFSQSIESSPSYDTPIRHSNTTSTSICSSLSSQFQLQTQNSNSSPELFSSASSSYSRKTLIGADASQQSMQTPSQLMYDWRHSSSPELFESSSREQQDSGTATQLLQTPALSMRGRTHALRRKLVQGTEANMSMLASTYHTPRTHNSTSVVNDNAFSPDIL